MLHALVAALVGLDWKGMAVPALSVTEKILRPLLIYAFLVVALRLAGKREMAQLSSFDFVFLLMLSNVVQNAIIGSDDSVSGAIIGALALLVANFLVARFLYRHSLLEAEFEGSPELLVKDGKVNRAKLAKELITVTELEQAARRQGIESLHEVRSAELGTDGGIAFVQKEPSPDRKRQEAILRRLDELAQEVSALRQELSRRGGEQGQGPGRQIPPTGAPTAPGAS